MSTKRSISVVSRALAILMMSAYWLFPLTAEASKTVNSSISIPFDASATITAVCSNHGPDITISGAIVLGTAQLDTRFSNNSKYTHTTDFLDVTTTMTARPLPNPDTDPLNGISWTTNTAGDAVMHLNKQPSQYGVGGNPWISFQFTDENGNPTGDWTEPVRCVQGSTIHFNNHGHFSVPLNGGVTLTAIDCSNHQFGTPGANIGLDYNGHADGANGLLYFYNNRPQFKGPNDYKGHLSQADALYEVQTTPDGFGYRQGGHAIDPTSQAGGNPLVYSRGHLKGTDPGPWTQANLVGRCNQI
jgi:hypothetical protein